MVINTNLAAMSSSSSLNASQTRLSRSLARISSGSKLVQPGDDAGGQAVAGKMDAQIHRLQAAKSNVANATSFVQTQDGYLKKIGKALDRMSELSILAQDVTKTDPDRVLYNMEFSELKDYINAAATKEFNGVTLFSAATLDVTIDSESGVLHMDGIDIIQAGSAYGLATAAGTNITDAATARTALTNVKAAITQLGSDRARIGAYQAHLNYSAEQLTISKENLTAASSRIQDVDIAEESTEYAKANIMVQSGTAMLAQANQLPQQVLRLLQ